MTPFIVISVLMMSMLVSDSPSGTLSGQAAGGAWGCGGATRYDDVCGSEGLCDPGFVCTHDHCVLPEVARILEAYWTRAPFKPPTPRYLRDEQGRAILLHGLTVDTSTKSHKHATDLTRALAQRQVKEWGFNGARFLMNWRRGEPNRSSPDPAYLDDLSERVQWYGDPGAWVFLGMHPKLYQQDAGLDVWGPVVKRFRDNPAVIGYDLMNAPHAGDLAKATGPSVDGEFETAGLSQLYRRLIPAIRALDPDTWIFFKPRAFGVHRGARSDLPAVIDLREGDNHLVYAPHLSPAFLHQGVAYERFDREQVASWAINRTLEAGRHNAALHVEIGASERPEDDLLYLEEVTSLLDYMGAGWSLRADATGPRGPPSDGDKDNPRMNILVRTYPQKIAGDPLSFSYQHRSKAFKLVYRESPGVTGPTEIFIPASLHYPRGWTVTFSEDDQSWTREWNADRQVLKLWYTGDQERHTIRINPAP